MATRELSNKMASGELAQIKLGGTSSSNLVLTSAEVDAKDAIIAADVAALDVRVTAVEAKKMDAASIIGGLQTTQALAVDTAERLIWMDSAVVDYGTDISYNLGTSQFVINTAGIYRVGGVVILTAPINDIVDIELYIDNLPTGFIFSAVGRGDASRVTFPSSFMTQFAAADEVDLYVKSTGTEVTVQSASVTVMKTEY